MYRQRFLPYLLFATPFLLATTLGAEEGSPPPRSFLGIPLTYADDPEIEARIDGVLDAYRQSIRGAELNQKPAPGADPEEGKLLWWQGEASKSLGGGKTRSITLEEMYLRALEHSTQIKVFSDVPLIRETSIQEAKGAFDTRTFVESVFDYTNDPIGSLLETGDAQGRFIQREWGNEFGVAKKLAPGTDVRFSQELGSINNNSQFLTPNPQGDSRLKLSIVQPLLNGAGVAYNTALLELARIDTRSAFQEQLRQSESHLLEITRAYWALYFARVRYVQQLRYLDEAEQVETELKARQDVDAIAAQLVRARSAVAFRKSDLIRSVREVANAQDRLRSLVNDPELAVAGREELIPSDSLLRDAYPVDYEYVSRKALTQRPEILQGVEAIRAASVREKVAKNEILPAVNLLLEGYVAGIEGDYNVASAWANQFNRGGPGFSVGISIEFPWENNAAKARLERRRLELRQQFNQLKTTVDTVLLEVKVSAREVETAWRDYGAKLEAVAAASADLEQLSARREVDAVESLPGNSVQEQQTRSEFLDRLLNAQTRLEIAEQQLVESSTIYQVAIVGLERAMGNLLQAERISVVRKTDENGLPILELLQNGGSDGKTIEVRKAEAP